MNIFFRVDASQLIGTGHFFRCLTLAHEMIKKKHNVTFVSRHLPEFLKSKLYELNISFKDIKIGEGKKVAGKLKHSSWLETTQKQDATNFKNAIQDADIVIVDHYSIDEEWEIDVSDHTKYLFVIDDLCDRNHYCDFLLDQNLYLDRTEKEYSKKVRSNTKLMVGTKYSLIRDEFIKYKDKLKTRDRSIKNILVFFGGIDNDNHTKIAINALKRLNLDLEIDVVVGKSNQYANEIKDLCNDHNLNFYHQISNIEDLMFKADISIGAGGSTSWERCFMGLPSIIVSIAENQDKISQNIHDFGAGVLIMNSKNLTSEIQKEFLRIYSSPKLLKKMSNKSFDLVDGMGKFRIMKQLDL